MHDTLKIYRECLLLEDVSTLGLSSLFLRLWYLLKVYDNLLVEFDDLILLQSLWLGLLSWFLEMLFGKQRLRDLHLFWDKVLNSSSVLGLG